jgi:AcrR family transcriptional regulator
MKRKPPRRRRYASPLRADLMEHTRTRILEAVGTKFGQGELDDLSIEAVARLARVSARTVYRHFPTKDDLLAAFWVWFLTQIHVADEPVSPEELPDFVERLYRMFDEHEPLVRGFVTSGAGAEVRRASFPRRRQQIEKSLESLTEKMSRADARLARAVVHLFYSVASWQTMRDLWSLNGSDAGRAAAWGMRVILAELRRNPKSLQEGRR